MKTLPHTATTAAFAVLLALAPFAPPAAAQQNSPEATAAAQRYRAAKAAAQPASAAASAAKKSATKAGKSAVAPAHANARAGDWNAQLVACKSEAGMNLIKREKCVYAHCKGHWGEGECPPGQDLPTKDSFKNPFKRSGS